MKFALASCGTRGDVEPCAAIGLELQRRGHEVRIAAPRDLVGFVESVGLHAVAYGPDASEIPDFYRKSWSLREPLGPFREAIQHVGQRWAGISKQLHDVADGADLLITGIAYQEAAANVAEYYDIPVAAWHHVPMRANGHLIPRVPPPLTRSTMTVLDWVQWRTTKKAEDAQRVSLNLPQATCPASKRMARRGSLEIQAYDKVFFPGLAAEWDSRRPLVGALTLELPTKFDDEVASWVAAGTAPIFFGFGSTPIRSSADFVATISDACADVGERALICGGISDLGDAPRSDHVKVVPSVSFAAIFPACRAIVHHGGVGTTSAALRAGVPSVVFWTASDQPIWAAQVRRLKVGIAHRSSRFGRKSLVADLRRILEPEYTSRAREVAGLMTAPAANAIATADLLEREVTRDPVESEIFGDITGGAHGAVGIQCERPYLLKYQHYRLSQRLSQSGSDRVLDGMSPPLVEVSDPVRQTVGGPGAVGADQQMPAV
jgi:UDP:flavonoid glycosyltransferase YjiC (YdhE family)